MGRPIYPEITFQIQRHQIAWTAKMAQTTITTVGPCQADRVPMLTLVSKLDGQKQTLSIPRGQLDSRGAVKPLIITSATAYQIVESVEST